MKRTVSIVLSIIMILALAVVPALATTQAPSAGTGTITITLPTTETAPSAASVYEIYKVFDATYSTAGISYTLVSGKATAPAGFSVDTAGNVTYSGSGTGGQLTDADIAAIAAYVANDTPEATVTVAAGTATGTATVPYGYYYITTTNGSVVTVDSTNPNASVVDKNVIPKVVKSAGTQYSESAKKAIAQAGTSQPFTSKINVGKGTVNLVFTDTMTNMTYNGDAVVTVGNATVAAGTDTFSITGAQGDASFTITFKDSYIAGLTAGTEIIINYTGKVASDALSTNPAKNTATITSGNNGNTSSDEVEVYNAKLTVTKKTGDTPAQPLKGAGFIVSRTNGTATEYYKLANNVVSWVTDKTQATMYESDDNGAVTAFTGLGAGTYTLIEEKIPDGYNKAADSTFTISDSNFNGTNLEQEKEVINNAGVELPATGGIGTKLFIAFGSVLAVAAGVVIVTNKRAKKEEI